MFSYIVEHCFNDVSDELSCVFPVEKAKIEEQMNTLYKVVHMVNFSTSLQALMLLYQVMDSRYTYNLLIPIL